jgi:hypothetical protein
VLREAKQLDILYTDDCEYAVLDCIIVYRPVAKQ